ncbi:multiple RNA-binding domain-containing protein 1-like isoform X3 [Amaranthus tricolor]|uniref:multiple RNA-binding domain-containing protein 1-like isoform X3 n=1 Tax=Amaranthus tricolor TaxID=29722 RepID=UPI0025883EC6|nr:multiple RNA-binding domain-containing protein 1-like isoform X3 [Amaranthus tricolor]XP_057521729.1 multiple RNA-binding domain-containing protein 1-like isoform X3 [Amaranthus tricolor]
MILLPNSSTNENLTTSATIPIKCLIMALRLGEHNNKHNHRSWLNVASKNITKKSKISSSRICVKNLPKLLTLDSVKDHFSRMGELTDAKLLRTREGRSRLAFIGYRTVEEAQEAIRYFNHSYFKNSRITCEDAWELGNARIPRPWSWYTKEKEKLNEKKNLVSSGQIKTGKKSASKTNVIDDPKLLEFLHVMQPQSKSKCWMNDELAHDNMENHDIHEGISLEKQHNDDFCVNLTKSSSMQYSLQDANDVQESSRLYIHNLPYTSIEDEVKELFNHFGEVKEVDFIIDKELKRFKGYGYVLYSTPKEAARALKNLDQTIFHGRTLHVKPADPKDTSRQVENHISMGKTYKQKILEKRKASESDGHTQAWNSLFMHPDTIVENIARKYEVSKSDLLDCEADDLAVRVALGETEIIADTKKALTNVGVNVASLEESTSKGGKRSNHVLLVKNLPFSSTESELSKLFGRFGSLDKIILPPTKTLALVIFLEPAEARVAFNSLRYSRYRDSMLYLEWAPNNIFDQDSIPNEDLTSNMGAQHREFMKAAVDKQFDGITQDEIVESRTLYVTNLNFSTTDECLRKHIKENMQEGKIISVRIVKRQKKSKTVSSGYGFVEFDSVETANNACKALQGTVLDKHALNFQHHHTTEKKVLKKAETDRSLTKLKVGNVAFEATEKDLRQLFSPFGQVKSLRLPKRPGGHRGFAFVEYVTKQGAEKALKALSSTHLYGRHLVLERAKLEETLEELRARTTAQFVDGRQKIHSQMEVKKRRFTSRSN